MATCDRCKPNCVSDEEVFGLSNRQTWEYVRKYYYPKFKTALDPAHPCDDDLIIDLRDPSDVARLDYEAELNLTYQDEYAAWMSYVNARTAVGASYAPFERWLEWKYTHGTEVYGNIPQHKKKEHVGHCWSPCPYSTQSDDVRRENMIGDANPSEGTNDHTGGNGKIYYMKTDSRSSIWGYECTFDNCPYNTTYGQRYFYS